MNPSRSQKISPRPQAMITRILTRYFGEKGYVLLLCILVGSISGAGAFLLKFFTHFCRDTVNSLADNSYWVSWVIPAIPGIGLFACVFIVAYIFRLKSYDKSLAGVITATTNGTSDLPLHKTFSHLITSGLAVGMGCSAGLEAPIALTGSAIGSNIAKMLKLDRESRTLLLACGAAGGISAIFNSPVAGALFACEILLPAFSVSALVPLLISSASATITAELIGIESTFIHINTGWSLHNVPFYVVIGLSCGLLGAYTIRTGLWVDKRLSRYANVWQKALFSSIFLYLIFLFFPALQGEGYSLITALLKFHEGALSDNGAFTILFQSRWVFIPLLLTLVFLKPLVSSVSVGGGGDGGIFGPSLVTGAFIGYFFYKILNIENVTSIPVENCIAAGMGGVLAGVMHAPMTGMFLIAEMTGGYTLFVPLMITTSLACFVSKRVVKYNIYKSMIVLKGGIPEMHDDSVVLRSTSIREVVESNFTPVRQNDTLGTLVKTLSQSQRNICPVLEKNGSISGIIRTDDIRQLIFNRTLYDAILVYDLMTPTGPVLTLDDTLYDAIKAFEQSQLWNLPVTDHGKYIGFVSKSGVLDRFRKILSEKQDLF